MDTFVHLEVQSAYSFLWGTFTPEDLVNELASLGQTAVALTDSGLHGVVRFSKAAIAAGIQPIVGARLPIWDGSIITLLARDFAAYGNLCRLISSVLHDGMAPKEPISKQDLKHRSKGLICLAGGWGSVIPGLLEKGQIDAARVRLFDIREALDDSDALYLTLQNHGETAGDEQHGTPPLETTVEFADDLGIPTVATNTVTFLRSEDYLLHRTLVDVQRRHHHRKVTPLPNDRFILASGDEMRRRVPYPEALANTARIAALCASFALPFDELHPPRLQDSDVAAEKLARETFTELSRLHRPVPAQYIRQLDLELGAINKLGMADFFLLVKEVVDFARSGAIRHSIRGSAAASLVVYLLLGGVDPIEHKLLFERFINDGRGDLPDIDVDFDSIRRDEVITYLMDRFPRETTMVATIHKLRVRSAVRLTARALGYPLDEISRLAKCLPWSLRGRDLNDALENLPELKGAPIHKEEKLVRLAARLTNLPYQSSVHLGGVIVAPGEIKDWTPVGMSPKGFPVGQLDKDDVEALGLLKLDLLGLRMHTAIRKALEILEEEGIDLPLEQLPLDDRKTYALLRSAETLGVFQLESPGQRNLVGQLLPERFSDLIAEISLFRPGPVEGDMVHTYVDRRNGREAVHIPHPDLIPVLEETYGVILFQEQVLRIVHVFAGLSYADADAFRRAMTKDRKSRKMELLEERFFEGALAKGHSRELVEHVFERVAAFASYGFCKAHAASFSHITYQSAYLKAHYPQAFYIGLLNAGHVGSYPPYAMINEARRRGIPIYGPHVNSSGLEYQAEGSGIRVPLVVINGLGEATARRIEAERTKRGAFRSRTEFLCRMDIPDRVVDALTLAGALRGFEDDEWELTQEVIHA